MIKLVDYKTENALPSEMKTPERMALSYAFDKQKKRYIDRLIRVRIWSDLESVDDDKLDFLAVENRVLFYNSDLSPEIKRSLIRNSIYWYMKLGTRQAMEEMIDTVFGNENTSIEEWYTYAGEPFHFRIAVGTEVTQTSISEFLRYLNRVKNARSRFDYMVFQNGITLNIYQISEYRKFVYTFCGDGTECGSYPDTEIGFQGAEVQITLEGASDVSSTFYTEAGTTPDISVGAHFTEVQVELEGESGDNTVVYSSDSEAETGSVPDISVGFVQAESGVSLDPESEDFNLYYSTDADKETAED